VTGARIARLLARAERWSPRGDARWYVLEQQEPWPAVADDARTRDLVRAVVRSGG